MRSSGAQVIKIAVAVKRLTDNLPLLDATGPGNTVAIGMGPAGLATRILADRFGSCWTYAGNGVAPARFPPSGWCRDFAFVKLARRRRFTGSSVGVKPIDRFVTVLDPATGTGTFLVEAIEVIHGTLVEKWKREGHSEGAILDLWNDYVPAHLLPRLHGYELLMAPYAIAHLKVGLKLHETGYRFDNEERARIYLLTHSSRRTISRASSP